MNRSLRATPSAWSVTYEYEFWPVRDDASETTGGAAPSWCIMLAAWHVSTSSIP